MKLLKKLCKNPISLISTMLIVAAPLLVSESACFFAWGEPEYPEVLKHN